MSNVMRLYLCNGKDQSMLLSCLSYLLVAPCCLCVLLSKECRYKTSTYACRLAGYLITAAFDFLLLITVSGLPAYSGQDNEQLMGKQQPASSRYEEHT